MHKAQIPLGMTQTRYVADAFWHGKKSYCDILCGFDMHDMIRDYNAHTPTVASVQVQCSLGDIIDVVSSKLQMFCPK